MTMMKLLEPYGPQLPLQHLVFAVNQIYHDFEALDYDARHPEVYEQLPRLWRGMTSLALSIGRCDTWSVLDFGCGTGFEAAQLLRNLPPHIRLHLTCYDPSPAMVARCRAAIGPLLPAAVFCSDLQTAAAHGQPYNLLITNSLLHHLPDPPATIAGLLPMLDTGALWLAGHEPSRRFYQNSLCRATYARFLRARRWRKFLSPALYWQRLSERIGSRMGWASSPARQTAAEAVRRGLFLRPPPARLISLLVDFHVAHSAEEASAGRGFDFQQMARDFAPAWHLVWVKTYAFMGSSYEGQLSRRWAAQARMLAQQFPHDGANFCAIWKRAPAPVPAQAAP